MAEVKSGSFNTSGYSDPGYPNYYVFSWSLTSQSIPDNTSTISWSLKGAGGSSGYFTNVKQKYVTVNGVTKSNDTIQATYNGTTAFSGTSVIKHGSNGKGSFSASAGGAFFYYGSYNSTGKGSWDLPTIARATTPTFSNTSVTLGSNITITLSPADSSFKHKLTYSAGSLSGQTSGLASGADFTAQGSVNVVFTPPTSLGSQFPNANSTVCTITCYTYNSSGTLIGTTTKDLTLNVPSYTPTCSISLTGTNLLSGAYVQSHSSVAVSITAATSYGATIKSYSTVIDGKTYTTQSFTTSVLSAGTKTATTTVTDSRGKTVTVNSASITVYEYSIPYVTSFTLTRQSTATTVVAAIKGGFSSINSKNAKTVKVTLNGVTNTVTLSAYTFDTTTTFTNVPTDSTFTGVLTLTDSYTTVTKDAVLPTVSVTMDFYKDGNGIAMGKVAEEGDLLDVSWKSKFRKILNVISDSFDALIVTRTASNSAATIKFTNGNGSLGYIGMNGVNSGLTRWSADGQSGYPFLDAGNTKDYIVERGTSDIWTYEKWNSGKVVCWGNVSTTPTTVNGNNAITVNLPITFVGTDYKVDITPAKAAMYVDAFGDCATNGTITHTTTNFTMSYKYSYGTAYAVSFNVTVRGKWK